VRLAAKMLLFVVLVIVAILAADTWYAVRRDGLILESDLETDARFFGAAIQRLVGHAWEVADENRVREILRDVNRSRPGMEVRWLWLDDLDSGSGFPQGLADSVRTIREGGDIAWVDRKHGAGAFYCYKPVPVDGDRLGVVEVVRSLEPVRSALIKTIRRSVLVGVLIAAIGAALAVIMGLFYVGRPLHALADKIRRVGDGDLGGPVVLRGHDELSVLAEGVNRMCRDLAAEREKTRRETESRIAALDQLRHRDRLATVGRLAAGVAHELGTPLNVAAGRAAKITRGGLDEKGALKCAEIIANQCRRMTEIIQQLLRFARPQRSPATSVDLAATVQQVVGLLQPLATKQSVSLCFTEKPDSVHANVGQEPIQQVLINLVMNAVQAMPDGGKVNLAVGVVSRTAPHTEDEAESEYVCVEVRDDGSGISPEDVDHVFEPFFTTKDIGEGTGLGLSIAYGIVRDAGGWIEVSSQPGKGSRFTVYLPQEGDDGTQGSGC